jgi:hypothetical protein
MKKFIVSILLLISSCTLLPGAFPGQPPGMPPMSPEDLDAFVNMIESLPADVKDELTKTGEAIIKRAEELGEDPFELIAKAAEEGKDVFEYTDALIEQNGSDSGAAPTASEIEKEEPKAPVIDKRVITSTKELIENILDALNSFKEKIVGDTDKQNKARAFEFVIDDLIYYLEVLNDEKLLSILHRDEFAQLRDDLKTFHDEVTDFESQLIIEEYELEGINPYAKLGLPLTATQEEVVEAYKKQAAELDLGKKEKQLRAEGKEESHVKQVLNELRAQFSELNSAYELIRNKEQSKYIFDNILRALSTATDTKKIIDEMKKIISIYEPETLKIKAEREKLEEAARKEQAASRSKMNIVTYNPFPMPRAQDPIGYKDDYAPSYKSPFDYDPTSGFDSGMPNLGGSGGGTQAKPSAGAKGDAKKPDAAKKKEKEVESKRADEKKDGKKPEAKKDAMPAALKDAITVIKHQINGFSKSFEKIAQAAEKQDAEKKRVIMDTASYIKKDFHLKDATIFMDELARIKKDLESLIKNIKTDLEKTAKTPAQERFYKDEVKKLFEKFEQGSGYAVAKQLLDPRFFPEDLRALPNPDAIKPAYKQLLWGIKVDLPKKAAVKGGLSDEEIKFINERNPIKDRPDVKDPAATVKRGNNVMRQLHELYKSIKNFQLDDAKRPIKISEM